MSDFVTLGSPGGKKDIFDTGARRDSQEGKTRFDLIPVAPLRRVGDLFARGAAKYGENNWQKGIPFKRMMASLLRHAFAYLDPADPQEEDHLAAVAWNALVIMAYEDMIKRGALDPSLMDVERTPSPQSKEV